MEVAATQRLGEEIDAVMAAAKAVRLLPRMALPAAMPLPTSRSDQWSSQQSSPQPCSAVAAATDTGRSSRSARSTMTASTATATSLRARRLRKLQRLQAHVAAARPPPAAAAAASTPTSAATTPSPPHPRLAADAAAAPAATPQSHTSSLSSSWSSLLPPLPARAAAGRGRRSLRALHVEGDGEAAAAKYIDHAAAPPCCYYVSAACARGRELRVRQQLREAAAATARAASSAAAAAEEGEEEEEEEEAATTPKRRELTFAAAEDVHDDDDDDAATCDAAAAALGHPSRPPSVCRSARSCYSTSTAATTAAAASVVSGSCTAGSGSVAAGRPAKGRSSALRRCRRLRRASLCAGSGSGGRHASREAALGTAVQTALAFSILGGLANRILQRQYDPWGAHTTASLLAGGSGGEQATTQPPPPPPPSLKELAGESMAVMKSDAANVVGGLLSALGSSHLFLLYVRRYRAKVLLLQHSVRGYLSLTRERKGLWVRQVERAFDLQFREPAEAHNAAVLSTWQPVASGRMPAAAAHAAAVSQRAVQHNTGVCASLLRVPSLCRTRLAAEVGTLFQKKQAAHQQAAALHKAAVCERHAEQRRLETIGLGAGGSWEDTVAFAASLPPPPRFPLLLGKEEVQDVVARMVQDGTLRFSQQVRDSLRDRDDRDEAAAAAAAAASAAAAAAVMSDMMAGEGCERKAR